MPDVEVLSVTAGGKRHRAAMPVQLPEGTEDVQVDYTVPSLRTPQRVTFRYRMAGSEAWQDAGTRRTAFFQRLGPGDHAFDVMAFDERGTASRITTLRFHIAPRFTQTWWFRGGAALAVLLVIALAYRLRTRRMAARIEEQLLVRVRERESIARSLHDTFLQSVQGMMLSMHAVMMKLPADSAVRAEFERVLDRAEHVLVEGRDEVRGLRGEFATDGEFWEALLRDVALTAPRGAARIRLVTPEAVARLQPKLRRDVYAIAREALNNALRHTSGPVTLLAVASARAFTLTVSDEGKGLGAFAGGKAGHFGLPGMRERAAQIGARLHFDSSERGTCVTLVVPGGQAYAAQDGASDSGLVGDALRTGA
ncbi:ATP-binding protein [Pseudoduganella lutea]|nr:histidine kinase [Pseudoduganella lutea]